MKRLIHTSSENETDLEDIFCMADVRGRRIKVESNVPFSFYYSRRNSSHGPRVKVSPDPQKLRTDATGNLQLCGDWSFEEPSDGSRVSGKLLKQMKEFFRKYLVMFLLVWEGLVQDEPILRDYLEEDITFSEFLQYISFYNDYAKELDKLENVSELEDFCRENDLVNFYGN